MYCVYWASSPQSLFLPSKKKDKIVFETLSGELIVKVENGQYRMDFPSRMPIVEILPTTISKSLNIQPKEILKSRDYVLVYENETEVRNIKIDRQFFYCNLSFLYINSLAISAKNGIPIDSYS